MTTQYLKEKKEKRKKIIGILFAIWFICSLIGMVIFTEYVVMIFGQTFFGFGLFSFIYNKEKENRLIMILMMIVGFCCLVIPYLMNHPDILPFEVVWDNLVSLLLLLGFLFLGIGTIYFPLKKRSYLNRVCNYEIMGTVVRHDTTRSDNGNTLYCPIYGFWYDGKDREISNYVYSNVGVREIGTKVNLKINPDNPEEFILDGSKGYLISIVVGFIVVLIMLPIIFFFLQNNLIIK